MKPGQAVSHYILQELLGRGATGEVWAVSDTRAMKLIRDERADDPALQASLVREIRAIAAIDHPNVLVVYDQGTHDGHAFLVCERGSATLLDVVGQSWDVLAPAIRQVLEALAHLHARGVVHRDVKPENVVWVEGRYKLADFGLAHDTSQSISRIAGSPAYMAPEVCRGQRPSPRSDLYALGCSVYHLLVGAPPFQALSVREYLQAHQVAPIPETGSPAMDAWLRGLLAKDPSHRFLYAADALFALPERIDLPSVDRVEPRSHTQPSTWQTQWVVPIEAPSAASTTLRFEPPPVPAHWNRATRVPVRPRHLGDVSMASMRVAPMVGRRDSRDLLWEHLRSVELGVTAVTITGPSDVGKSALLRWLGQTAMEVGAAHVVRRAGGFGDAIPAPQDLPTDRAVLLLLDDAHQDPDAVQALRLWSATAHVVQARVFAVLSAPSKGELPGTEHALRSLNPNELAALVGQQVALDDEQVRHVVDRADGSPGAALEALDGILRGDGESERQLHLTSDTLLLAGLLQEPQQDASFIAAVRSTGLDDPDLDAWRQADLLVEVSTGWRVRSRWRDLLSEVASPAQLRRLHACAARVAPPRWTAHHLLGAGQLEEAVTEGLAKAVLLEPRPRMVLLNRLLEAMDTLEVPSSDPRFGHVFELACKVSIRLADYESAHLWAGRLEASVAAHSWDALVPVVAWARGYLSLWNGTADLEAARAACDGPPLDERAVDGHHLLILSLMSVDRASEAVAHARYCLDYVTSHPDKLDTATGMFARVLAQVLFLDGQVDEAIEVAEATLELPGSRQIFSRWILGTLLTGVDPARARRELEASCALGVESGNWYMYASALIALARLDLLEGCVGRALERCAGAQRVLDQVGSMGAEGRTMTAAAWWLEGDVARARAALPEHGGQARVLHDVLSALLEGRRPDPGARRHFDVELVEHILAQHRSARQPAE